MVKRWILYQPVCIIARTRRKKHTEIGWISPYPCFVLRLVAFFIINMFVCFLGGGIKFTSESTQISNLSRTIPHDAHTCPYVIKNNKHLISNTMNPPTAVLIQKRWGFHSQWHHITSWKQITTKKGILVVNEREGKPRGGMNFEGNSIKSYVDCDY